MPIDAFFIITNSTRPSSVAQIPTCQIPEVIESRRIEGSSDVFLLAATVTCTTKVVPVTQMILAQDIKVEGVDFDLENLVQTPTSIAVNNRPKSSRKRGRVDVDLRSSRGCHWFWWQCQRGRQNWCKDGRRSNLCRMRREDSVECVNALKA